MHNAHLPALDTAFHECAHRTMIPGSLLHNLKVNPLVIGWHFSGIIESTADGVTDLKKGDKVFGHLQYAGSTRQGSLAEYITVRLMNVRRFLKVLQWMWRLQ